MSDLSAATPADLAAVRNLMATAERPLHFIAGGTDMLVHPRPFPSSGCIVNIAAAAGLRDIVVRDDEVVIGAAVTLSELQHSAIIRARVPVLAQAADLCGSVQIRNRATIGGNVVNASPAGDLLPILVCMSARVSLLGRDGVGREMAIAQFLTGAGRTMLGTGELLVSLSIPLAPMLARAAFVKLGQRDDLTISRLNLTLEADFDEESSTFGAVRCVAGAVAPTPLPLATVAETLAGRSLSPAVAANFLRALVDAVDGAIPGRLSQSYKRRAVMGVGLDALQGVADSRCPLWEDLEALL